MSLGSDPNLLILFALIAALAGCHGRESREADANTTAAVQRLALDSLFRGREHATRIALWATDAGDGPVMSALESTTGRARHSQPIDLARLSPALPATVLAERDLDTLFRQHPDAWAAFFRQYAGSPGLVELVPVTLTRDGERARTYVGRSCGEHCRHAWRVVARRVRPDGWIIDTLHWVAVPAGR